MANMDYPESTSYRDDMGQSPTRLEETGHVQNRLGNTIASTKGKLYDTRYFIIKSFNHENIQLSVEHGVWATQMVNEPILEEAFHTSNKVILIFSVNTSGFFQGYGQMMSSIGTRENIWGRGRGKNWVHSFEVKWLRLSNLPFQKTIHLKNPLNNFKPVKISRDCQELSPEIGEALCELFYENSDVDGATQSACMEPSSSLQDEEYGLHSAPLGWNNAPVFYPPLIYQRQVEASAFRFSPHDAGVFTAKDMPIGAGPSGLARKKHCYSSGNRETAEGHKVSSQYDNWGLPAESPLNSTLTEDDLLEMSYEEYLEAHSRGRVPLFLLQAAQVGQTEPDHSRSRKRDDDRESSHTVEQARSRKRARHSSSK